MRRGAPLGPTLGVLLACLGVQQAFAARQLTQVPGLAGIVSGAVSSVNSLVNSDTAEALLSFRDNVTNWDEVYAANAFTGWNDSNANTSVICTWSGLLCGGTNNSQILGLSLPGYGLEGTLEPWNLTTLRTLNLSSNFFSGTLPDNAGSYWSSMNSLDLSHNNLTGPLPPDWGSSGSFLVLAAIALQNNLLSGTLPSSWATNLKNVTFLDLASNTLTGSIPAGWAAGGAFPSLTRLDIARNVLGGTLPTTWGSGTPATLPLLRFFNGSMNGFTGPLPAQWGEVNWTLNAVDVGNNSLSGTLPTTWEYLSMYNLSVAANKFNGTLPASWGSSGLWNPMTRLLMDHNALSGTLPSNWGTNGSMAALTFLSVNNNNLTGSIPSTYATRFTGKSFDLQLTPGNAAVCGGIPSGLSVSDALQSTYNPGSTIQATPTGTCPLAPPPPPPLATPPPPATVVPITPKSSSGISGGAIAGIIVGVLAALAILALLIFCCIRRRRAASYGKQKSTIGATSVNSMGSVPTSEEYRHLNSNGVPSSYRTDKTLTSTGTTNGHKMDSDEMLSGAVPSGHRRGTTVEMSNPDSATQPRSSASTQDWSSISPGRQRNDPFQLPHNFEWRINPEQLKIAKRPDGRDWKLGAGGFGTVYKAYKDEVQEVAVKVFKPEEGGVQAVESNKFQMEIAIMKGCRDRNIVQFYGACIDNEQLYMVTEFMENGDLFTALNNPERGPSYTWYKKGRKIALDVARGLHYLHSNSVIHFDLKSANILLSTDDSAKLADVGLSHALTTKTHVVNSVMRGTWSWAAPETITGLKCTEKVDIWSYGIVLWELCTIEQPERGRNRPVRVPEECPKEIDQLIAACTDPDPHNRPTVKQIIQTILKSPAELPAASS